MNVTIEFYTPWVGVLSSKTSAYTVQPLNIVKVKEALPLNLAFDYPVYLRINVTAPDDSLLYETLTPIVKPSLKAVYVRELDPSATNVTLELNLKSYVDLGKEVYVYVAVINSMQLTLNETKVVKMNLPEQAHVELEVITGNDIYESYDKALVNISLTTVPSLKGTINLYVEDKLVKSFSVEGNVSLSCYVEVPLAPMYSLRSIDVKAEFVEQVSGKKMAEKHASIYVYNSGPTIILNSPPEGSTLNGTVTIDLTVEDPAGVESVTWKWDFEKAWQNITEPYDITIDTLKLPNGLARLIIVATDKKGFTSEKTFYFTIYNEVREAWLWQVWASVGTLLSRYAFLPGIAIGLISILIGIAIAKFKRGPKQPIIVKIESSKLKEAKGGKVEEKK